MWHKHWNHHVKSFLGKAYHTGKNILGHIDHTYRTARKIYNIAQPALEHFAPETKNTLDKNLSKAANDYEEVRHKVVDAYDRIARNMKSYKVLRSKEI